MTALNIFQVSLNKYNKNYISKYKEIRVTSFSTFLTTNSLPSVASEELLSSLFKLSSVPCPKTHK